MLLVGLWIAARHRPRRLPGRRLEPGTVRQIRAGLPVRPRRDADAGRHLDRARRHPVGADRLCAHVEEPLPVGARLRLCLFLPRHAAAGADLPDLLRRWARSGRSSRRSACGGSSARPGIARSSPSRSTPPPIRPKSCAARSRACRRGQWEGAASLGLHKLQTLRKVILPQALIVALRPYGNEIILMIKGSAVVAHHHRLRPDGRDAARLFRAASTSRPISGRR